MPNPPAHYHPLVRSVARALRHRCRIEPDAAIVVGCSGGADSVALLRALAVLAPRRKWRLRLIVGHIQHHLRDEAEDDAAFVQRLAESLALPFARGDIRPADLPGNLEANARDLRYAALAQIADQHRADAIATAHHADDQLETLLMRMLRGTSVAGLRGIAWRRPIGSVAGQANGNANSHRPLSLIRPMLGIDRATALALLDQLGQAYRDDATNDDTSRTRAALRHDAVPLLKALQPDAAHKANALTDHFRDLYELVQASADAVRTPPTKAPTSGCAVVISREQARATNPAVLAEVLRRALLAHGCDTDRLGRAAIEPVVRAARDRVGGSRRFGFTKGLALVITREAVALSRADGI